MKEEEIYEMIPSYLAGELSEEEARMVERALESSRWLRHELERYERLFVLLSAAAAQEIEPPWDLEVRIRAQVAMRAYLKAAFEIVEGLAGNYGRALIYYLGLS
ncbi:anti-sigma factor family protein [Rubrobacter calidifluminis]|uniref:anti-sigma factor family protein n=1 Tax=Rubrobacter calidifluminis TaxID=1392640 RepID=UPI00235F5E4B|nr:zf-HC2 domain-containing protein [Rubrobacter calidifluminis]